MPPLILQSLDLKIGKTPDSSLVWVLPIGVIFVDVKLLVWTKDEKTTECKWERQKGSGH